MSDLVTGNLNWPVQIPQYGKSRRHPVRRFAGLGIAVAVHVLLIWALVSGLANKVVQIVQRPIETRIIVPVQPPPPPPPKVVRVVSHPRVAPPPPPFVPPPEVHVPVPPAPVIAHQDAPAPSVPAAPAAPVPVAKPVSHEVGVVCPNSDDIRSSMAYPEEAQDNNITGDVTVAFTVDADGNISNEKVTQSADPVLDRAAFNTVRRFHCVGQGQSVRVEVPFTFKLS